MGHILEALTVVYMIGDSTLWVYLLFGTTFAPQLAGTVQVTKESVD